MSNKTTFTDYQTPVVAAWLNDVDKTTFTVLGDGSLNPPPDKATLRTNIGVKIGTDVAPATTGTSVLKGDGAGGTTAATTDNLIATPVHAATNKTTPVDTDELPLVDNTSTATTNKVTWANVKATLKTYFDGIYTTASAVSTYVSGLIGVTIQAYDALTAKLNVLQSWTKSQRGAVTTANTASYDMNTTNNWITTLAAGQTLAFSNITVGQSGNITFVNGSNYTIAKNSYIKCGSNDLTTLSATGTYWISYYSPDGTNVYLTVSGALS